MVSRCIPHGLHVDSMWFPCGPHVVSRWIPHHFQITSVANWSRKLTNLWKPITSLIMVRFSIRKKFWKALGLLYQLVLVLMSFPCKWKWPRHFPFGQISLQSHVTTLNQPIRSLNSLKSPSSRRHFSDFVRFHQKFHPCLKSKAVRTALLKMNGILLTRILSIEDKSKFFLMFRVHLLLVLSVWGYFGLDQCCFVGHIFNHFWN